LTKPVVPAEADIDVRDSNDNNQLQSEINEGDIRVWQASDAGHSIIVHILDEINETQGRLITKVEFKDEDTSMIVHYERGEAQVWPLVGTLKQLARYALSLRLPRQLTPSERAEYSIDDTLQ
jgi:hypothetical protein